MVTRTIVGMLMAMGAASVSWALACSSSEEDEAESVGEEEDDDAAEEAHDRQVCLEAMREVFAMNCPAGLYPRAHFGGDPVVVKEIEDADALCGGFGHLIDADAAGGPEWVGTNITHNSVCVVGCFTPACGGEARDVCVARRTSGEPCAAFCSDDIDEPSCRSLVMTCNGIDPEEVDPDDEACGLEPTGGG